MKRKLKRWKNCVKYGGGIHNDSTRSICSGFEHDPLANMPKLGNLLFGHSYGKYPVKPREEMQEIFAGFLEKLGCDMYGMTDIGNLPAGCKIDSYGKLENDVFSVFPYYWGDEDEICAIPNFAYKPEGLELRWYKYPMRDAYSNKEITSEDLRRICRKCVESVRKGC